MKIRSSILVAGLALASLAAFASESSAQSFFATRGLGYPSRPQDARSAALGGVRLGLPGATISWANPAASVGLPAPGLLFVYQYDDYDADLGDGNFDGSSARFPLVLAAFPAGERISLQIGFGSQFDQNWQVLESDTLFLGADTVPVTDWWQSQGGVNRLRFGAAATVVRNVSAGIGLDVYTGSVDRLVGRAFPNEVRPACCTASWEYRGIGLIAGAHWSPTADSGLGVTIGYGGKLTASPQSGLAVRNEFDLPVTLEAGGSARLGTNTLVAVSGSWAGWSGLDADLAGAGGASDGWSVGGGVEWDGITIGARPIPVRLGARTERLPFGWDDDGGQVDERAASLGAGLELANGGVRTDAVAEFGSRDAGGLIDESFWRLGFTLRVLGL